jgi:predicted nucleic acid-binding protein
LNIILDTCVISEIQRKQGLEVVKKCVSEIPEENLYLSVITIGEIAKGVALLDEGKRKDVLEDWLSKVEEQFNILTIDSEISHTWGEITASARRSGFTLPAPDGLIAATALHHDMHLMTRNTEDFSKTGAKLINPWPVK